MGLNCVSPESGTFLHKYQIDSKILKLGDGQKVRIRGFNQLVMEEMSMYTVPEQESYRDKDHGQSCKMWGSGEHTHKQQE